jgi:hypothetical protein
MDVQIDRSAINADCARLVSVFLALLHNVMVVMAEGLPVDALPEQALIPSVQNDTVDDQTDAARVRLG